jgi:hypothetical protein
VSAGPKLAEYAVASKRSTLPRPSMRATAALPFDRCIGGLISRTQPYLGGLCPDGQPLGR